MKYNKLVRFFTIKTILIFLFLWVITNLWMRFGASGSSAIQQLTGEEQIPDLLFFGYSKDVLFAMLNNFGTEGRGIYLKFQYTDFIYPLIYSSLLVGLLIRARLPKPILFLIFIPWLAALMDYTENLLIRNLVLSFPVLDSTIVSMASFFTFTKWLLIFISFAFIVIFGIRTIIQNYRNK